MEMKFGTKPLTQNRKLTSVIKEMIPKLKMKTPR